MFSFYRRIGAQRYQEQYGLDFEDFAPGQRFRHRPGATLSQQDNVIEALDTLNGAMLHYDAHYAAGTAWQKPLMVSTLTLQRVIGMASKTFGRRTAILGFPEIVLNGPLFGGDTLYAASEIRSCDDGVVTVRLTGHKSDGAEIGRFTCNMAIARRDPGAGDVPPESRFAAYHPDDSGALVEQCGLFFEDCVAGESFVHAPRRSFFPEEVAAHAWRALELAPRHQDMDWVARHHDGRLLVPEPFLIGTVTALTTRNFGRVSANLGWLEVTLPVPVHAGDTIEAESSILDTRESRSRPDEGIVSVATIARNQRGETVLTFRRNLLVYRRHAAGLYQQAGY
jgi:itaconyl-CoA hydratase